MTKEQWLENMKSETPDYNGLLDKVSMSKDRELLKYLIDELSPTHETSPAFIKFIENVIDSDKLDWIVPEEDIKAIEEWTKECEQYRLDRSDEFICTSTSSSSSDVSYTYKNQGGKSYTVKVKEDGTSSVVHIEE